MTKTQSTFSVVAVTLLVLASVPMFNQPTAVAQAEGGGFGACLTPAFGCAFAISGDKCLSLQGMWYGQGSFCSGKFACDTVFGSCPPESVACCLGDGTCLVMVPNLCLETGGTPSNTACFQVTCDQPCYGDVDGDGSVGITDFLEVLAEWGACP